MWNKYASKCAHINTIYIQKLFIETCQVEGKHHSFYRLDLRCLKVPHILKNVDVPELVTVYSITYFILRHGRNAIETYSYHRHIRMADEGQEDRNDTRGLINCLWIDGALVCGPLPCFF